MLKLVKSYGKAVTTKSTKFAKQTKTTFQKLPKLHKIAVLGGAVLVVVGMSAGVYVLAGNNSQPEAATTPQATQTQPKAEAKTATEADKPAEVAKETEKSAETKTVATSNSTQKAAPTPAAKPAPAPAPKPVEPLNAKLSTYSLSMSPGSAVTITGSANAADGAVKWQFSSDNVAAVVLDAPQSFGPNFTITVRAGDHTPGTQGVITFKVQRTVKGALVATETKTVIVTIN